MRLHQELVLGMGGVRALRALGLHPRSGTSTRATPRSCSRARARIRRRGHVPRRRLGRCQAERGLHDPHAGLRRQRAVRRGPRPTRRGPAPRRRSACRSRRSWTSVSARTATAVSST
jgi:hypothetical protein